MASVTYGNGCIERWASTAISRAVRSLADKGVVEVEIEHTYNEYTLEHKPFRIFMVRLA